jgi:hypothetical protein
VPPEKILKLGEEDNFWSMGDGEGPCGPCTEIFYDTFPFCEDEDNRWIEVWNLVFMQFSRQVPKATFNLLFPFSLSLVESGMARGAHRSRARSLESAIVLFSFLLLLLLSAGGRLPLPPQGQVRGHRNGPGENGCGAAGQGQHL